MRRQLAPVLKVNQQYTANRFSPFYRFSLDSIAFQFHSPENYDKDFDSSGTLWNLYVFRKMDTSEYYLSISTDVQTIGKIFRLIQINFGSILATAINI